jgi:dTDP-4-dehydrorhamnose 3,5-epimerase
MPFEFRPSELKEVILITPGVFSDERGFFMETYRKDEFVNAGIDQPFVQANHSHSVRGVLRGLHYQLPPHAQGKLIRCVRGCIFDVSVDVRKHSPTFGEAACFELSEENKLGCYIPPGFAHGFYTLSEEADVLYWVTAGYAPESERGILWNDPDIDIPWPSRQVLLSPRDSKHPLLRDADIFP